MALTLSVTRFRDVVSISDPCANFSMSDSFLDTLAAEGEESRIAAAESRGARRMRHALKHEREIAVASARRAGLEEGEKRAAARIAKLEAAVVAGQRRLAEVGEDLKVGCSRQHRAARC